jgi:purine nucleosidase
MTKQRVILDTDIGDDIDDAFALALLLRCPEIELAAVTTVFGGSGRADLAASLLRAAGREAPVACGCRGTIAASLGDTVKLAALDRQTHRAAEQRSDWPGVAEVLRHMAGQDGGEDVLLTIGPMTNLAISLVSEGRTKARPRLVAMCGEFQREGFIEHNIRCDVESAAICFGSGMKIDVIPWSIGPATQLLEADVERLERSEVPLVKLLVGYLHEFWKSRRGKANMYDPMTVVALLRPELFEWRRGRVTVELRDEKLYGLTRFEADEAGPHRVAFGVRSEEAKGFMMERLVGAGSR